MIDAMILRLIVGVLLIVTALCAQTGQITGIVTDSSGAFLPAAQIIVTNIETAVSRTTISNARGNYSVPLLQPGDYNVTVQASGFKTLTRESLRLQVRGEAFNLLNRPVFGLPNTAVGSIAFGAITSQRNDPRQVQLGLRIFF